MNKIGGGILKFITCWCLTGNRGKRAPSKTVPIIFVFGKSGSGKATVGLNLADAIGYTYLNAANLIEQEVIKGSLKGKLIEDLRRAKSTIPADVITGIISDHMPTNAPGFVIAAFPNNITEAKRFEMEIRKPNVVVLCSIPEDLYRSRYGTKHGSVVDKVLKQNYMKEHKATEDVYKYYEKKAVRLDTSAQIEENTGTVLSGFHKMGFTPGKP